MENANLLNAIVLSASALIATLSCSRQYTIPSESSNDNGMVANPPANAMTEKEEHVAKAIETNGYYLTIVDEALGDYAVVSTNRESVILRDKAGKVTWTANVVKDLEKLPLSGERKISSLEMVNGELIGRVGRGYVRIDKKTGHVTWLGSD
jgi:hypothetical protein